MAIRDPIWSPEHCDVFVVLPEGSACADFPGFSLDDAEGGRDVCRVAHADPSVREADEPEPRGPGWYRDLTPSCGDRIAFVPASAHAEAHLECFVPLSPPVPDVPGRGTRCLDDAVCVGLGLACDPLRGYCNVPCTRDADCAAAGWPTLICDRRELGVIDATYRPTDTRPYDMCVDPSC